MIKWNINIWIYVLALCIKGLAMFLYRPAYAKFVEHEKCRGKDHVTKELARIIALGGEGLMIRQPGSKYERTRSKTLLKIKKFHDAEVIRIYLVNIHRVQIHVFYFYELIRLIYRIMFHV